jgi:uncharacterized protein (TIGR02145 family)
MPRSHKTGELELINDIHFLFTINYTNLMRTLFIKSLFCVIFSLSWVWGDCEEGEVELWGECYNIEETTELNLGWSGLTGQIPPEIGNLTNLIYLYLGGNELNGQIPSEIGNLINLTWLNLGNNQMTGEIPSEMGYLTNLEGLYLDYNEFTGQIPPEIGNLFDLINLNLGNNLLTGDIPSEIGTLTNLIYLYLGWNELTGQIPSEIGNLTNLTGLGLLSNQLTGEIPTEIGNLINLVDLSLNNNQLTGEIPSEIGNLTNLFFLGLHFNQLTGDIPLEIGTLTNLNELNLSYNQLTGEIPEEICNQGDTSSSLSNNQLCPPYPECLTEEDIGYQDTSNCDQNDFVIVYQLDWNLVGLPLDVEDAPYSILFPESIEGTLYSFDDGYISESYLTLGKGYWLRFTGAGSTTITGSPISELTITLTEGWNLISGITNSVDVSDIQDPSGIIIPGTVYEFSFNGYSNAESIEPGKGYWLRTYQSGDIILTSQTPATVTDIDGNVYNTVSIGDQLWMAENLKVTHYQNGDEIPYSYNDPQYGAYAEYSNDASNVAVYGRLYNWFAVNDARGLCPVDWQVPSDDELQELEMYLGMSESEANSEGLRGTDEGGKLKEEGTEHWNSPNTGATNETGFTALPGGRRDYDLYTDQEVWCCLNRYGFFWSSSEIYSVNAWYRALSFDYAESNRYHLNKRNGFSVRCVKD